jgi:hypothetical protein
MFEFSHPVDPGAAAPGAAAPGAADLGTADSDPADPDPGPPAADIGLTDIVSDPVDTGQQ